MRMRKWICVVFLLSAGFSVLAQNCPFKVKFDTITATCYNNGKVAYALVDAYDNVLTSASGLNLTEVRSYYIEQGDTTKHYSGRYLVDVSGQMNYPDGWDTLTLNYGTYTIGVEALCWDGTEYVKKDTQTVLTILTSYTKPSASSLYVTANTMDGFGRRPTLECKNTGRVQLKIENGKFPYYVTIVNHDVSTDTLRTDTLTGRQYSGSDITLYDYKDYYSFDSLPRGDWDFYVIDGCDYGLPRTGQKVEVVDFPLLDYVEVYASSGNMHDSNVVKINAVLDKDYSYYSKFLPQVAEYRFVYSTNETDSIKSEWKTFPEVPVGFRTLLTDTVAFANKYCDIWDKDITLQYKRKQCVDTIVSRTFHHYKPNEVYFVRDSSDIHDSINVDPATCTDLYWWHRWFHEIYYKYSFQGKITEHEDHNFYRHHYTHPLTWVYYDTELDSVIKREVVYDITSHSRLYDQDVEAVYGDFRSYSYDHPLMLPIRRTLLDAHGCVVYTRFDSLPYCYDHGPQIVDWEIFHTDGDHCCTRKGTVGIREHYHSNVDPDGTIITLEKSPYDDQYNFTAVYSSATRSWTVTRSSFENFATIEGSPNGLSITLSDYCLPSGPYWFKVKTPCHTFYLQENIAFPDVYSTKIVEEPEFTMSQVCTDSYITYSQGKYARERRNTSVTTGLPLDPATDALTTCFQIIEGPAGGYDGTLHYVNEPIRISMPGDFVVKIAPSTSLELCNMPYRYDTVHYGGPTVEFVYAYAYLCDSNSTTGAAYVKGANGTPPYTYTLFSEPDKQGDVLGTITMAVADTANPAIFVNKPMNAKHEMSCLIEDACGAYFHVNFYPRTLADLQKIWFDDGLTVMTTCEGSTISVHALEIANILEYKWYNPENQLIDSVSSPSIFIPRGATDGRYKVVITGTDCTDSIVDSVQLHVKPSPWLTLTQNDTLCPGEPAHLTFTPTSPTGDDITFTIAFENANGIVTRNYASPSGQTVQDDYTAYIDTKIYPVNISDGEDGCSYTQADANDTIYIVMKKNIVDVCTLVGSHDTVCYGSNARFTASSTMEKPYTLTWYKDYNLTHKLKTETITDYGPSYSYYDTAHLTQHAEIFFKVEKDGFCPTVNGIPTNTMNMTDGATTIITCGKVIRLYDDGGADGDYATGQSSRQTFATTDGKPVTIHFEQLNLSETAHLLIFSGAKLHTDSLLFNLTHDSGYPGMVTSRADTLTLYFIPGMKPAAGWKAIVEHQPGISTADVWKKNDVVIRDEVCQSQTNTYDDPYHVVPRVVNYIDTLNKRLRKAGTYTFTRTLYHADVHGCDSTVTFILTVNPPIRHDTTVVTTNFILNENGGYFWPVTGRTYTTTGRYSKRTGLPDGCDSLDVLDLLVLQIDTTENEICRDDTTRLGVTVSAPDMALRDDLTPPTIAVGDIYCTDSVVRKLDSVLAIDPTGKLASGVVFYVDQTGMHGRAVSITDASGEVFWSRGFACGPSIHRVVMSSLTVTTSLNVAMLDMDGEGNTAKIIETLEEYGQDTWQFNDHAPAAFACYYYPGYDSSIPGYAAHGWYLPALGELRLLYVNRSAVNNTILELQSRCHRGTVLAVQNDNNDQYDKTIWSSTQVTTDTDGSTTEWGTNCGGVGYAWYMLPDGKMSNNRSYAPAHSSGKTRAVIKF